MTNRSIEHNQEYYQLSAQGEAYLEKIDDYLYQIYQQYSKEQYFQQLDHIKTVIPDISISNHYLYFTITGDKQKLEIEIEVLYPGNKLYEVKSWKVQSIEEWNPDQKIDVL